MSLSKPVSARRLVPALFPLAHADVASAAASRRERRKDTFVATPPTPAPSPRAVCLAEPLPTLAPSRLAFHNRILALLSGPQADLPEAALLTRHALHSNCRPSSFTCAAILAALLRARRLEDFFALHRFALQAAVPPTAATHVLYLSALAPPGSLPCRRCAGAGPSAAGWRRRRRRRPRPQWRPPPWVPRQETGGTPSAGGCQRLKDFSNPNLLKQKHSMMEVVLKG